MVPDLTVGFIIYEDAHYPPEVSSSTWFRHCTFLSCTHLIIFQLPLSPKDGTLLKPSVIPWMSSTFLSKCGLWNVFLFLHHSFHEGLQCIHFSLQWLANSPWSLHHSVWRPSKQCGLHPVPVTDPSMHLDDLCFLLDFLTDHIYPSNLRHGLKTHWCYRNSLK